MCVGGVSANTCKSKLQIDRVFLVSAFAAPDNVLLSVCLSHLIRTYLMSHVCLLPATRLLATIRPSLTLVDGPSTQRAFPLNAAIVHVSPHLLLFATVLHPHHVHVHRLPNMSQSAAKFALSSLSPHAGRRAPTAPSTIKLLHLNTTAFNTTTQFSTRRPTFRLRSIVLLARLSTSRQGARVKRTSEQHGRSRARPRPWTRRRPGTRSWRQHCRTREP